MSDGEEHAQNLDGLEAPIGGLVADDAPGSLHGPGTFLEVESSSGLLSVVAAAEDGASDLVHGALGAKVQEHEREGSITDEGIETSGAINLQKQTGR